MKYYVYNYFVNNAIYDYIFNFFDKGLIFNL